MGAIPLRRYAEFTERPPGSHQAAFWDALEAHLTPEQRGLYAAGGELRDLWEASSTEARGTMVTLGQLEGFGAKATPAMVADLNSCIRQFNITSPARLRHFLAQVMHESGLLRWLTEIASGDAYEGRRDLGNTQPGDGRRFKGAGAIQLTGRYNYQLFANYMDDPEVMQGADYVAAVYPFTSAGYWWQQNGMNSLVDQGASCREVSRRVNGRDPANGLADRERLFAIAHHVIKP